MSISVEKLDKLSKDNCRDSYVLNRIETGLELLSSDDFSEAIAVFDDLTQRYPDSAEAWFCFARTMTDDFTLPAFFFSAEENAEMLFERYIRAFYSAYELAAEKDKEDILDCQRQLLNIAEEEFIARWEKLMSTFSIVLETTDGLFDKQVRQEIALKIYENIVMTFGQNFCITAMSHLGDYSRLVGFFMQVITKLKDVGDILVWNTENKKQKAFPTNIVLDIPEDNLKKYKERTGVSSYKFVKGIVMICIAMKFDYSPILSLLTEDELKINVEIERIRSTHHRVSLKNQIAQLESDKKNLNDRAGRIPSVVACRDKYKKAKNICFILAVLCVAGMYAGYMFLPVDVLVAGLFLAAIVFVLIARSKSKKYKEFRAIFGDASKKALLEENQKNITEINNKIAALQKEYDDSANKGV